MKIRQLGETGMNFEISSNTIDKISADGLIAFVFEGKKVIPTESFLYLDKVTGGYLTKVIDLENIKGESGGIAGVFIHSKTLSSKIYIVGLGKKEEFDENVLRRVMALFAKTTKKKITSVALLPLKSADAKIDLSLQGQVVAEGLLLGDYGFTKYQGKQSKEEKVLEIVSFSEANANNRLKIKQGTEKGRLYFNATKIARDLVNEPAALVNPSFLAKTAQDMAKGSRSIKCTIYDKSELEKMGMGAFLGIAQAADTPPKFIHLEYTPSAKKNKRKLAIVGKGITFDSGGVSIKPSDSMKTMKSDMSGAAAVLAVFSVLSKIKPDFPVMGLIAATPNLISGRAIVPGDVVKALNGKTIEILNTDAEGRVTLADSLYYAVKKGATEIIDLATLTGACMVALGDEVAGIFSNNKELKEKVEKAAKQAGEKVWELPLSKEYKELNKSEVADLSNIPSTRYAGAITAALFLEEFVDNKPWVHLDIAGPAFAERNYDLGPKGGTGYGVRTLLNYLKEE